MVKAGLKYLPCTSSNAGEPTGGLSTSGVLLLSLAVLFDGRLLEVQLQEALLPGASSCAAAQHFPWAEPSCWQVSCPAGLQAGEGSACGGGQGLLLSHHGLTFQPTACPYNLVFEEGGRKGQRSSRQIFVTGFCAPCCGFCASRLPELCHVAPAEPDHVHCSDPTMGLVGSWGCSIQGVFCQ